MNENPLPSPEYDPQRSERPSGRAGRITAILIVAAIVIVGFATRGWLFRPVTGGGDMTCDITEPFEDVSIGCVSCDVSFSVGGSDTCIVEYRGPSRMVCTAEVRHGTLVIEEKLARRLSIRNLFGFQDSQLTVFLPAKQYDELTLETVSGDVDLPAGDSFRTMQFTAVSGEVELSGAAGGGDVTVETVSGDVEIRDADVRRLKVSTTSGEQVVKGVMAEDWAELSSVSGNIELLDSDAERLEISTISGDVHTALQTVKEYVTDTTSGEVSVAKNVPGAGRCAISTVSGDITCE